VDAVVLLDQRVQPLAQRGDVAARGLRGNRRDAIVTGCWYPGAALQVAAHPEYPFRWCWTARDVDTGQRPILPVPRYWRGDCPNGKPLYIQM
jgi:hypothetical protein